jgi:transposase
MRVIGLDVSRTVGEIAYLEDGQVREGGRVVLQHHDTTRYSGSPRACDPATRSSSKPPATPRRS